MKCEKHGVEMEWRGSLAAGRMYCEQCAAVGGVPYSELAKGPLSPEFKDALADRFVVDAKGVDMKKLADLADQYASVPKPARRATSDMIQARLRVAERMIDAHARGHTAYCPYCCRDTTPDHTKSSRQSHKCYTAYCEDVDSLARSRP